MKYQIQQLEEKIEKLLWEKIKLEEQNENLKRENEELKQRVREKLPLALLKEYMNKFE
jgi:FtsZ-binding cell division protein ZapB